MATEFIECTSLNISYDTMGIAQVSYTVVHDTPKVTVYKEISAGGKTFKGYVTSAYMSAIQRADGWYQTNVTMVTTTN